MPIAGRGALDGKNTNALTWMHGVVRIADLSQSAPTILGVTGDGTSTPTRYTGTQFIAVLECDFLGLPLNGIPAAPQPVEGTLGFVSAREIEGVDRKGTRVAVRREFGLLAQPIDHEFIERF